MSPELLNPAMGDDQTKFNLNSSARLYISRHRAEVKPERNCIVKSEVKPTSNLSSSKKVKTKPLGIAIHASQVTRDCPLEDEDLHIIFFWNHFTQNLYYSVTQLIYWESVSKSKVQNLAQGQLVHYVNLKLAADEQRRAHENVNFGC